MKKFTLSLITMIICVNNSLAQNDTICILSTIIECEESGQQLDVKIFSNNEFIKKTYEFFNKYENEILILKKNDCLGENIYSMCTIDTRYMADKIPDTKLYYYHIMFSDLKVRVESSPGECSHNFIKLREIDVNFRK